MSKRFVILCVDDEITVLDSLKVELNKALNDNYLIETVDNGEEALSLFQELIEEDYEIPLVIADYIMPSMKGDELLKLIHEKSPLTLSIMLTGQATVEGVANAVNYASLYHFISKPWDSDELRDIVNKACKKYLKDKHLGKSTNIFWHDPAVTKEERIKQRTHKSCILWYTGLSGSGKSTIANAVDRKLTNMGLITFILDGDNIRHGLNKNLDFTPKDRQENIRRISEVAKLFVDAGVIISTAFISPYRSDRNQARNRVGQGEFIEIFVKCSIDECERRDAKGKGLYKKAKEGIIPEFTGISAPYEEPENPEIVVNNDSNTIAESADIIINYLIENEIILK